MTSHSDELFDFVEGSAGLTSFDPGGELSPHVLEQLAALEAADGENDRALAQLLDSELNGQLASPERLLSASASPQLDRQVSQQVVVPARRKFIDDFLSLFAPPAGGESGWLLRPSCSGDSGLLDELEARREAARADRRLHERLQQFRLGRYEVRGDGNCQFRSLADQLYRSQGMHRLVREQVVRELLQRPEHYRQFVHYAYDKYCAYMASSGSWGDHITLQAAANSFAVAIHLITSSEHEEESHLVIEPAAGAKPLREIWLAYLSQQHYDSIYPVEELAERRRSDRKCQVM